MTEAEEELSEKEVRPELIALAREFMSGGGRRRGSMDVASVGVSPVTEDTDVRPEARRASQDASVPPISAMSTPETTEDASQPSVLPGGVGGDAPDRAAEVSGSSNAGISRGVASCPGQVSPGSGQAAGGRICPPGPPFRGARQRLAKRCLVNGRPRFHPDKKRGPTGSPMVSAPTRRTGSSLRRPVQGFRCGRCAPCER